MRLETPARPSSVPDEDSMPQSAERYSKQKPHRLAPAVDYWFADEGVSGKVSAM